MLTAEMKQMMEKMGGAYIATASKAGVPNVSFKGTTRAIDDNTIAFACIMSENTINNLKENANVAITIADPTARRGFQFKGTAAMETSGKLYDDMKAAVTARKLPPPKCVAKVAIKEVLGFPPGK